MKKFVTKCFFFFCLLLFVFAIGLAIPSKSISENIHYANLDKHERLVRSGDKPRLLLVGGSNLTFGVLSPMIEEQFDVEVINTAVHAGYGLKYIIDDFKPYLREGDTVLLVPEYAHFFKDGLYGNDALLGTLNINPGNLKLLDRRQLMVVAANVPTFSLQKIRSFLTSRIRPIDGRPYSRASFNENGDVVAHWDMKPKSFANVEVSGAYNSETMKCVRSFANHIEARGGKLLVSYPCLNRGSFLISQDAVLKVQEVFEQSGLPLLGTPERYSLEDDYHFDTHYHLRKNGQTLRTQLMIEDLAGIDFASSRNP